MRMALIEVNLASSDPTIPSCSTEMLQHLEKLGHEAIVVSADPRGYGGVIDDVVSSWVTADTTSAEAVTDGLKHYRPDAVVSMSDLFVPIANEVARRLPVVHPHNSDSPAVTRDKAAVRQRLDHAGIRNAAWTIVTGDVLSKFPLPAVIKPVDGCASWDVRHISTPDELTFAVELHSQRSTYGRGIAPRHTLMLEEVLDGPLVSLEGFANGTDTEIWGQCDRSLVGFPYFVETGSSFSADPLHPDLESYGRDVINALGYIFGPFHMEIILTSQGPTLVEFNPRLIGGGTYRTIELATGVSGPEEIARRYLGLRPRPVVPTRAAALKDVVTYRSGTVRAITGLEAAAAAPGVVDVVCGRRPGEGIRLTHSNSDGYAYVLATASDRYEARARATFAASMIQVRFES